MKHPICTMMLGLAMIAPAAVAQSAEDPGRHQFMERCAACHGEQGKGDGPYAAMLRHQPADLTTLTARHAGTYPAEWVARVIDGRDLFPVHGTREMPIWGREFVMMAAFEHLEEGRMSDEDYARLKTLHLTRYIQQLQR